MIPSVETGFIDRYLEVIKGLRIVPESPRYAIRPNDEDGTFVHEDDTVTRFKLINTLCKSEEMTLFDREQLALRIVVHANTQLNPGVTVKAVSFREHTGLG